MAPLWTWLAHGLSGGGISSRLGLAHAVDRPIRTALLVAMYSIVIFTVTFMAIINSVFQASAPTMAVQSGGSYDLMVTANPTAGLSPEELADIDGVQRVVAIGNGEVSVPRVMSSEEVGDREITWNVSLVGADFLETAPPTLLDRSDRFADDARAWAAVANGVSDGDLWVVMPEYSGLEPGDEITMVGRDGVSRRAEVAGISNLSWLIGTDIYASVHLADELGDAGAPTRFFLTIDEGADAEGISHELESKLAERGVVARSFLAGAKEELDGQQAFLQILQGYLAVGLLIGIAGLGVVLARAVRERRRQIAMMRAMGFSGYVMRRAFLIEAGFIGLQGVCLGIGLGLLTGWQTLTRSGAFEEDLTFDAPLVWMVGFGVACLMASMLAAVIPAMRAGRLSPAAALRLAN
jgi:putative ABC transport system permease protein